MIQPPTSPAPPQQIQPDHADARQALEAVLFEVRRVIVGQDGLLERLLVALLAGGHVLLEGVPGLAKTLDRQDAGRGRSAAPSSASSSRPTWCRPTSSAPASTGPTRGEFDTELGPVFANFVLADEINRAPAKVQSALLEVMQERQVTIGRHDLRRSRSRSWSWPPRTRSSPRAPTRCPRPRSTAS